MFCKNKKIAMPRALHLFCCALFLLCPFVFALDTSQQKPTIKTTEIQSDQTLPSTLKGKIKDSTGHPQIIEIFDSALFGPGAPDSSAVSDSSFMWLHDPGIQEKRSKIIGSEAGSFSVWWKIGMDGFLLKDRLDYTQSIQTRLSAKLLTRFTDFFFAYAEYEIFTGSGSVQKIFQRVGEGLNGISHREVLLLLKPTDWLTLEVGAVNQSFLQAPLLLGDIPFPSVVENIELFSGEEHTLSLSFQQALPTTFSDKHSIFTQSLTQTPLLITKSFFWDYDSKSYYKARFNSTFFHYNPLPSDIALSSLFAGNTIVEEPAGFKYRYTGFHLGISPSIQIFPNLGLQMKANYIINIREEIKEKDLNQGLLYSLRVPFDITENIRVTPVLEYFINQPDASVGYYNSSRYGHSNRTGFVGEVIFSFYNRNMEVGFRHLRSRAVRAGGLKNEQTYYLIFLRTGYAKI